MRVEYTFLWFIENYSYCWQKKGERLQSPHFTANELESTSWRIGVYPRGERDEDKGYILRFLESGYISLYLFRLSKDGGPKNVSINFELSILAEDGSLLRSKGMKKTFDKNKGHGWAQFEFKKYCPQDTLTVRCRIWKDEGKVHKVAPICARTRIAIENISFLHIVENFSALGPNQKKTVEIQSQSKKGFVVSSSLYFTDYSCCEGEMVVEITPSDSNHILCKRKMSLLDVSGNIIACGEKDNRSDDEREDIQKLPLCLTRQAILKKKSEYLPDDKLSLLCNCVFSTLLEFEKVEEVQHEINSFVEKHRRNVCKAKEKLSTYPSVSEDIKALYLNRCLTDVELKTKTKSFPAHKVVLCARSPVFKAMMNNDMEERDNNCIQVDDLGDDVVQQLLLFLYSDTTENLQWNTATQLLYASDKYQIDKLKAFCSSFLVENLTTTNAGEILVLADTHNDSGLKESVEKFILAHEKEVFGSKEWEMLIEKNPLLVIKTMHLKYDRE